MYLWTCYLYSLRNLPCFSHCPFSLFNDDVTTIKSLSFLSARYSVLSLSVAINWQTLSLIANSLCALYCVRIRIPGLEAFRKALQPLTKRFRLPLREERQTLPTLSSSCESKFGLQTWPGRIECSCNGLQLDSGNCSCRGEKRGRQIEKGTRSILPLIF